MEPVDAVDDKGKEDMELMGEEGEEAGDCDSDCGVSCSVKRLRSSDGGSSAKDTKKNVPEFMLVLLSDVYGDTENYPAVYAPWNQLTKKQRKALFRSIPDDRNGVVPCCDSDHDFGVGFDAQGEDHVLEGNIWTSIDEDKNISEFTDKHHCEVTVAYFNA